MKKILLVAMAAGAIVPAFAEGLNPNFMNDFLSTKISPDGKVIVSRTYEESHIYYVDSKETVMCPQAFSPGNGNSLSQDGKYIVGSSDNDFPVVFVDGKEMDLTDWAPSVSLLDFHGITPDGKRIVGITDNPNAAGTETAYAPFYVDINADGTLGEINYLPFPAKDWMGLDVQYCSAVWVSADGKTILGQVCDWSGMDMYPILYTEGVDGEWSYSLPTEAYINPDKLPIPVYPGDFDYPYCNYEDYMTEAQLKEYEDAQAAYYEAQDWEAPFPEFTDFMDPDKLAQYEKDYAAYQEAAVAYNDKLAKYNDEKMAIEDTSLFFIQNAMAMSADAKTIALTASVTVENDDPMSWMPWKELAYTYIWTADAKDLRAVELASETESIVPTQVLSDGTLISSTANGAQVPTSYVLNPGSDKFVGIVEYLAEKTPAAAEWMKEHLSQEMEVDYDFDTDTPIYESFVVPGRVLVGDDWSVLTGGSYNADLMTYVSYVITPVESGVSEVAADAKVVSEKYYDLNGFEVKDPANGIYILRTIYTDGTVKAAKVVVE